MENADALLQLFNLGKNVQGGMEGHHNFFLPLYDITMAPAKLNSAKKVVAKLNDLNLAMVASGMYS